MLAASIAYLLIGPVGSFVGCSQVSRDSSQPQVSDAAVEFAISGLCSLNEKKRQQAKDALRSNGTWALPALLDLHRRIIDGDTRFYATESESGDARTMYEDARRSYEEARRNNDTTASNLAWEQMMRFDITPKLLRDVVDLLAELRSEEATKALINSMRDYRYAGMGSNGEPISDEMQALIDMKSSAMPLIIEALSAARREPKQPPSNNAPSPWLFASYESRLIRILGKIGDPRALPILQELAADAALASFVEEAVTEIMRASRR